MNHLPIGFGCLLILSNLFICHNSYAMAAERYDHQTIFGHEIVADCCDNHWSNLLSKILKKMHGELTADTCPTNTSEIEKDENNGNVSPSDLQQRNNGCCLQRIFFLKRRKQGSSSEVIELVPSS